MIATTPVHSRHLLELGLDPCTADMCYEPYMSKNGDIDITDLTLCLTPYMLNSRISFPAWSLSALLEVMPNNDYWDIYLFQAQDGKWQSVWNDCEISNGEAKDFISDTPIDAAYEMVCWLLEQGLIKKGGQDK